MREREGAYGREGPQLTSWDARSGLRQSTAVKTVKSALVGGGCDYKPRRVFTMINFVADIGRWLFSKGS